MEFEGIAFDPNSMACEVYQCDFVNQQYRSTFFRDTCNNGDYNLPSILLPLVNTEFIAASDP